ncbi:MAG: HDOD domain-containing protein [Phycisphaerales bacterium]|nr:HDOD domain-containing protein [Phycisphaerales bacterium]NNM27151.1 HDOD domain-containing protein [Phycisphaerales bacterium]
MGATTNAEQAVIIDTAIKGISHIATLPEITLKIIELVEDPSSTAQDLHKIISNDPALCSRILKVVNSAFYGLPRQIGSINRAIVLLGLNAVKNIAIAASLTKLFRGGDLSPQFSARDLWIHSIATAAASKLLCDELRLGLPDEAFLAGLMHDIGIMVEMQAMRKQLVQLFDELPFAEDGTPTGNMLEMEQRIFGADHQAFGAGLCESWKFPKSFGFVSGHHHDPLVLPRENRRLSSIVYLADRMTAKLGLGFRADLPDLTPDEGVIEELGVTREQIANVEEGLPKAYEEVEATFA